MVICVTDVEKKEFISSSILYELPEWFGLQESIQKYIADSKDMPFWASYDQNGTPNGFIVLKETSSCTCEIYVMGITKKYHHQGIGTELWYHFLDYAKKNGYEYVQVKTLQSGVCKEYDITNHFYEKIGFKKLEVFPTLWDESNPCQVYVKYIG
jgi:ribosomal protein S18 acetylase RimI-like enzyme